MTCYYCPSEEDLRQYGPEGSYVCYPCGASPEHEEETMANFIAQMNAARAMLGEGGMIVLDAETGNINIMSAAELEQYGGRPSDDYLF